MRRRPPLRLLLSAIALCAVALLNVAVVKSAVMQTAMAAASPDTCRGDMAAMPGMGGGSAPSRKDVTGRHACAFCSAAAHAPLQACAPALPVGAAVAWVVRPTWASQGPRGPPERGAHARGPPAAPLIA